MRVYVCIREWDFLLQPALNSIRRLLSVGTSHSAVGCWVQQNYWWFSESFIWMLRPHINARRPILHRTGDLFSKILFMKQLKSQAQDRHFRFWRLLFNPSWLYAVWIRSAFNKLYFRAHNSLPIDSFPRRLPISTRPAFSDNLRSDKDHTSEPFNRLKSLLSTS